MSDAYPEHSDGVERAVRGPVGLDHAEHAMELPEQEEHDEEMVRIPEALEVSTTTFLDSEEDLLSWKYNS